MLLHDRASMRHALTLDLEPKLHALLMASIARLTAGEHDLIDWTEYLIVQPDDTESDIIRHVGFSPLVEPIEGTRFGMPGFQPFWDWLIDHAGWFELSISFGSTFAYILFIEDAEGLPPDLLALCRRYGGGCQ